MKYILNKTENPSIDALDNLENYFTFAGITERYNESLLVLKNELQWSSPFYSIANKSKKNDELLKMNNLSQQFYCYLSVCVP